MNSKRVNLVIIGITCLLGLTIILAMVGASNLLKQRSKKLTDLKLQSKVLDQQLVSLSTAKKDIEKYSELNREARIIVPQDKDQAQAVREITQLANKSNIHISGIFFPASNLGNSKAVTSTTSSESATTPGTSSKAPPISQTQQLKDLKGVYILPITVHAQDTSTKFNDFINFLHNLEQNRRTAQVTSIDIIPSQGDNTVKFTLVLNTYLKP